MPDDAATVFRRIVEEIINKGNLDAIEDLVASDYIDHAGGANGPEGYRQTLTGVRRSFSDMDMTVHDIISGTDRIAVRCIVSARHTGEFMGIPATGRTVTWEGIGIIRFENGRMAERWNVSDMLGLVEQLQA